MHFAAYLWLAMQYISVQNKVFAEQQRITCRNLWNKCVTFCVSTKSNVSIFDTKIETYGCGQSADRSGIFRSNTYNWYICSRCTLITTNFKP